MKRSGITIVLLIGLSIAGFVAYRNLVGTHGATHSDHEPIAEKKEERTRVKLSEMKWSNAGIHIGTVERRSLQPTRTVPGRIDYNGMRHVSVSTPVEGAVRSMSVLVGDRVEAGKILAIVDCPEIGERRADILKQKAEVELAKRELDWTSQLYTNVDELLGLLKRPQDPVVLEREFAEKPLGSYRKDLFPALAKFRTAETLVANMKGLAEGAISTRAILEQRASRDAAAADFQSACEQAAFDSKQNLGKAKVAHEDALRRLEIAKDRLHSLTATKDDVDATASLSTWEVRAPFDATVEDLYVAATERVQQGDAILLLADTSKLWVQADIREKDWSALNLTAGQKVQVQTPAITDRTFEATINFVGRTVGKETRAAQIVAEISNDERLFKPGLYVSVILPDGKPTEELAVPVASVVRHEGRTMVFVETGEREFEARDVAAGREMGSWITITSGLSQGDRIVDSGTFVLKSELLLEAEE